MMHHLSQNFPGKIRLLSEIKIFISLYRLVQILQTTQLLKSERLFFTDAYFSTKKILIDLPNSAFFD